MIYTTEEKPSRDGWIYEEAAGGGYYGYRDTARPDIQWNHIDGPLLHFRNGEMHWLTWRERFRCWIGWEDALSIVEDMAQSYKLFQREHMVARLKRAVIRHAQPIILATFEGVEGAKLANPDQQEQQT